MILALLLSALLAQDRASALPAPDTTGEVPPVTERCKPSAGDEVTVCAKSGPSPYRITNLEPRFTEKPVRAEFKIPGLGTGKVYAEQRAVGTGGVSAPAAMVSLSIPLGGKKKRDPRK